MRIGFLHSRDCSLEVGITARLAALSLAHAFNPRTHSFRSWFVDTVRGWQAHAFDCDCFAHAVRINSGVEQREDSAERMAHQINRKIADYVGKRGEVEQVFRYAVERAGSPLAIAMTAEIHGVDVKMFA